jgi:hypothetical protein
MGFIQQVESEQATLKDLVKWAADGVGGQTFDWCTNDGPDRLQLGYVAETFRGGYRILFDRRLRTGTHFAGESPISAEEWQSELRATAGSAVWSVRFAPKLHDDFSGGSSLKKSLRG